MTTTELIDRDILAKNLRNAMQGTMEPAQLDATVDLIRTATTAYPATGSIVSLIFYLQVQVIIQGGKTFNGKAGGISTPGAGALAGVVYTSDINALYSNTKTFEFNSTVTALNVNFFDGSGNLLGSSVFGAISIVAGIGGGKGSWS